VTGIVIEQLPLRIGTEQGLAFVLPEDFHQQLAKPAQIPSCCWGAVDEGTGAAVGTDDAADGAAILVLQLASVEPLCGGAARHDAELGGDLRLVRAVADQAGVCARADHQAQGVDKDRFAGTGLAGQRCKAGLPFEFQRLDDGEITDVQVAQHAASLQDLSATPAGLRPQCSLSRSSSK
jgi:hypothetical protein